MFFFLIGLFRLQEKEVATEKPDGQNLSVRNLNRRYENVIFWLSYFSI